MLRIFLRRSKAPVPLGRWDHRLDWEIRADQATWDSGPGYAPREHPTPSRTASSTATSSLTRDKFSELNNLIRLAMS